MKVKGTQENRLGNQIIAIPPGFTVVVATKKSMIVVDDETGSKYRYLSKTRALDIVNKNLEKFRKCSSAEEYERASKECEKLKEEFLEVKSIFQRIPENGIMDMSMTFRFAR